MGSERSYDDSPAEGVSADLRQGSLRWELENKGWPIIDITFLEWLNGQPFYSVKLGNGGTVTVRANQVSGYKLISWTGGPLDTTATKAYSPDWETVQYGMYAYA